MISSILIIYAFDLLNVLKYNGVDIFDGIIQINFVGVIGLIALEISLTLIIEIFKLNKKY